MRNTLNCKMECTMTVQKSGQCEYKLQNGMLKLAHSWQ